MLGGVGKFARGIGGHAPQEIFENEKFLKCYFLNFRLGICRFLKVTKLDE